MNQSSIPPLLYRVLAVIGVIIMASGYSWQGSGRPGNEWCYALLAAVAGASVLVLLAPEGCYQLRRHLDLLVPFGVYHCMAQALTLLPMEVARFQLASPWTIFEQGFAAVSMLVAMWILATIYLLWQTQLIVQVATSDELDLGEGLSNSMQLLLRGLAISLVAYAGLLAPLTLVLWLGIAQVLLLGVILVWSLAWGLLTCLWLPLALDRSIPFWTALQQATETSRRLCRHWLALIVAWALALGLVTLHVYRVEKPGSYFEQTSWHVQGQWYGGYPYESRWYTKLAASAEVPELMIFGFPLMLLYLCLAIAVKIEVVGRTYEMRSELEDLPEPGHPY